MGTSDTAIGIDFGTTNSAIARSDGREVRLGRYGHDLLSVFRTLLFFQEPDPGTPPIDGGAISKSAFNSGRAAGMRVSPSCMNSLW